MPNTKTLDLNKPADARKFFRDFRTLEGKMVEWVELSNGQIRVVAAVGDEEVCDLASKVAAMLYERGLGYFVETAVH